MAKRGCKLQEFVGHSSNVKCLRIGKKACRFFLTNVDDYKVNLWSIGKPKSLMSLCGHISPVESVAFDASEILVLGGTSSGVIKLWDLEEAKMVRGLTGHRSNCTTVEFHPSGSTDTNLKIWDIHKKVVTDFKFHENHIQALDFHPLEFLMATGSAKRTVKYWDLETFELIGSCRPEVVRHFWECKDMKGVIKCFEETTGSFGAYLMHVANSGAITVIPIINHASFHFVMVAQECGIVYGDVNEAHGCFRNSSMLNHLCASLCWVDLHTEERLECCNQCWTQLQKIQKILPLFVRMGGLLAKSAQELNLVIQQPC